jgi:hypothetical protein
MNHPWFTGLDWDKLLSKSAIPPALPPFPPIDEHLERLSWIDCALNEFYDIFELQID